MGEGAKKNDVTSIEYFWNIKRNHLVTQAGSNFFAQTLQASENFSSSAKRNYGNNSQ